MTSDLVVEPVFISDDGGGGGGGGSGGGKPSDLRPGEASGGRPPGGGTDTPNDAPGSDRKFITGGSIDPNCLSGPTGFGPAGWISHVLCPFLVEFENKSPDFPAAEVIVRTQLDPTVLDLTTFQLGSIILPDRTITPEIQNWLPVGPGRFSQDFDLQPEKPIILRVLVELDLLTGMATWHFLSLDPNTMELVEDPLLGFLDPGKGGSCLFSVRPKEGLPTGTTVTTRAEIKFDYADWLPTNSWTNTLDNSPPTVTWGVTAGRPGAGQQRKYNLKWSPRDSGSGFRDATIYVSKNGGAYEPWLLETTDSKAIFLGDTNASYAFHIVARDNVGNTSPPPPTP